MKNFKDWLNDNDLVEEKDREEVNGEEQFGWDQIYRELYGTKFFGKDGKVVTVEEVDTIGGEGQGDQYYLIFSVNDGETTTIYKLDGWYASHHGADFNDNMSFYEVSKQPVTHMEWVKVK